jgi:MOSC domain-containing protein YiiM
MHEPFATLLSIQVGLPRRYGSPEASDPLERPWRSAIFKTPIRGPVAVTALGVFGDGQAERKVHGGEDKALLAYAASHYPRWHKELGRTDMGFGGFGENLTIEGLDETTVCIGDVYSIGTVRLQVSQPRQPCWKLARRWRMKDLPDRVTSNGRSGWYLRVLTEGTIDSGQSVLLEERPCPEWTVARASQVMHFARDDRQAMAALASLPPLAASWRETLTRRIEKVSAMGTGT